jgi:uncharacterized repeat protein (TIGR03803 family)
MALRLCALRLLFYSAELRYAWLKPGGTNMRKSFWRSGLVIAAAMNALPALGAQAPADSALKVIQSFKSDGRKGANPTSGLIADSASHFYGAALTGGDRRCQGGCGTVFQLTPSGNGWALNAVWRFRATDGAAPVGAPVLDSLGNLYGATGAGGVADFGTIYRLTPPAAGARSWARKVLYEFTAENGHASAGLTADSAGNLYGVTMYGGADEDGTVFELSPPASKATSWRYTELFSFNGTDGAQPMGSVLADSAGNLYGTTNIGGAFNGGTVFELSPPAPGQSARTETVLTSFDYAYGYLPSGALFADSAGNLYGTTSSVGSSFHSGTVYELSPPSPGQTGWTRMVLFRFKAEDGPQGPAAGVIADGNGNLYGTSSAGGRDGYGTLFELLRPGPGETQWGLKVLYSFDGIHGEEPVGATLDGTGRLYGTTYSGGAFASGVIFKIKP